MVGEGMARDAGLTRLGYGEAELRRRAAAAGLFGSGMWPDQVADHLARRGAGSVRYPEATAEGLARSSRPGGWSRRWSGRRIR